MTSRKLRSWAAAGLKGTLLRCEVKPTTAERFERRGSDGADKIHTLMETTFVLQWQSLFNEASWQRCACRWKISGRPHRHRSTLSVAHSGVRLMAKTCTAVDAHGG